MADPVSNDATDAAEGALSRSARWLGLFIGGVWLVVLYVVFILLVVFSLSAHQLQYAISQARIDDKPVALWSVTQQHGEWKVQKTRLDAATGQLVTARGQIADLEKEQFALQGEQARAKFQCEQIVAKVRDYVLEKYPGVNLQRYFCTLSDTQQIRELVSGGATNSPADLDYQKRISDADSVVNEYNFLIERLTLLRNSIAVSEAKASTAENEIAAAKEAIAKILGGTESGVGIGDFLGSLAYFEAKEQESAVGELLPDFTAMPPDMLTLILVMAMGALGGTIHLTRRYFKAGDDGAIQISTGPVSYFVFRPFLGAITAFAVYVLAKAGVLVISAPSVGEDSASLSPFFVSFLGIISGLLAEQALDTIQRAGTAWFSQSETAGRARWGFGLAAALGRDAQDAAGKDAFEKQKRELAETLGVSAKQLDEWIAEEKPVPPPQQMLIAAYLHRSPRELFSDMRSTRTVGTVDEET